MDEQAMASAAGGTEASAMLCSERVESVESVDGRRLADSAFDRRSWLDLG